jgi:hypothetical protein
MQNLKNANSDGTAFQPVYSEVRTFDTNKKASGKWIVKKDLSPTAYTITLQGRTAPTQPWVTVDQITETTSPDPFAASDVAERDVVLWPQMRTVAEGVTVNGAVTAFTPLHQDVVYTPQYLNDDVGQGLYAAQAWQDLNIFTPVGYSPSGGWPVVVFTLNSGFNQGTAQTSIGDLSFLFKLLEAGFAVVSVGMTGRNSVPVPPTGETPFLRSPSAASVASEVNYKAQYDVQFAVQWVRAYGSEYGLNTSFVTTYGDSGGGYYALYPALAYDAQDLSSDDPIRQQSSVPDAVMADRAPCWWPGYDTSIGSASPSSEMFSTGGVTGGSATPAPTFGAANAAELRNTSPAVLMYDEAQTPGIRERIARLPMFFGAPSDGPPSGQPQGTPPVLGYSFLVGPVLSTGETQLYQNPAAFADPALQGSPGSGLQQPHMTFESLLMMYRLRSLSRALGDKVGGEYWHDQHSELWYTNNTLNSANDYTNWGGAVGAHNATLVTGQRTNDAPVFLRTGKMIDWLKRTFTSLQSYPTPQFLPTFNDWLY